VTPLSVHTRLTLWYAGALLAILVVTSAISYSLLAWGLAQDVDRSLLAVAGVVRDATRDATSDAAEQWLRDLFDPEHQLFQLLDPDGTLRMRSRALRGERLPLSPTAQRMVLEGRPAFDTFLMHGERVRVVTLPVRRGGRLVEVVQVGASLRPTERALERWIEILAILVPVAVGLAAAGGRVMARALRSTPPARRSCTLGSGEITAPSCSTARSKAWAKHSCPACWHGKTSPLNTAATVPKRASRSPGSNKSGSPIVSAVLAK